MDQRHQVVYMIFQYLPQRDLQKYGSIVIAL